MSKWWKELKNEGSDSIRNSVLHGLRLRTKQERKGKRERRCSLWTSKPSFLNYIRHLPRVVRSYTFVRGLHTVENECPPVQCFLHTKNELQSNFHLAGEMSFFIIYNCYQTQTNALILMTIMSKNRKKSKLSKNI